MLFDIQNIFGYNSQETHIIAFSLWGNNPKYILGAIKNAELARILYPKWKARFYCGSDVDTNIIHQLKNLGSQVYVMKSLGSWNGMFWRFLPASEKNVERFISRDCDSRLTQREVDAVNEWIDSGTDYHVMRDHPYHRVPILGGMWGHKGCIPWIKTEMEMFDKTDAWQTDQEFLAQIVWPKVTTVLEHDEFFRKNPFPTKRVGLEFVGEAFDENGNPNEEHRSILWRSL